MNAPGPLRDRRVTVGLLAGITILGAAARLYLLDHQSLWHDEAISVTVSRAPIDRMFEYFASHDGRLPIEYNPPVYALLLHGWFKIFGVGGFEARLLSATAGVIAIVLVFALARTLYDRATGLCAALLLAVSQLGVMFSQEARNYEVFLVLVLATAYGYWVARAGGSLAAWCAGSAAAVLMVLTHYYGVFVILALTLFTLMHWRSVPLRWVAGTAVAGALVVLPWLTFALAGQVSAASDRVQPEYFRISASTIASTINRFNNGATAGLLASTPLWTLLTGMVLFGGPILLLLWRARRAADDGAERRSTVFVLLWCVVPLASVLGLGVLFNVQYNVRYVAFCIAPYYILVAAGVVRLPRVVALVTIVTIVGYSGLALRANYDVPYKENYRDAIRLIAAQAEPDDCYVFVPFGSPPLEWAIYASDPPARRLTMARPSPPGAACHRIWVLTYQRVTLEAHERWRSWLAGSTTTYTKSVDRRFFWVSVERYDRTSVK